MATLPTVTVDDPHVAHGDGHHDGHGHEEHMLVGHDGQLHPSNLRHYFVSSEQQFESSKLGMWLFLSTEILLFGGMFVAYGIFRVLYPEVYEAASLQLDTVLGALNTLVLLLSSLTMAWAIRGAQMDNRRVLIGNLVATIALASVFLVVKYFEYTHKFHEGIFPGINFQLEDGTERVSDFTGATELKPVFEVTPHEAEHTEGGESAAEHMEDAASLAGGASSVALGDPVAVEEAGPGVALDEAVAGESERAEAAAPGELAREAAEEGGEREINKETIFKERRAGLFFSIYFVMTGIHALHIVIGIVAIGFLTFFSVKGRYSSVWYTPVENVGLYWHIVDIIWIFVFPLMYLI